MFIRFEAAIFRSPSPRDRKRFALNILLHHKNWYLSTNLEEAEKRQVLFLIDTQDKFNHFKLFCLEAEGPNPRLSLIDATIHLFRLSHHNKTGQCELDYGQTDGMTQNQACPRIPVRQTDGRTCPSMSVLVSSYHKHVCAYE